MNFTANASKNLLPVNYPLINSYPYHANLFSIISGNQEYLSWVFNHYIQLLCPKDFMIAGVRVDYYQSMLWKSCPWIYYQRLSRDFISKKWGSITQFIIDSIDLGYYVYFNVDTFFITPYDTYNSKHIIHDMMVYGYDLEEQILLVADNFKEGDYSFEKATFEQVENAYNNIDLTGVSDWLDGVELISYRKKTQYFEFFHEYQFDVALVKESIKDYLSSTDSVRKHKVPSEQWKYGIHVFGMEVYSYLLKYLIINQNQFLYDNRPFYLIWEHKKIMHLRIHYMKERDLLNNADLFYSDYQKIKDLARLLANLWIKFGITQDTGILPRMIDKLNQLVTQERIVLERMLDKIKNES